MMSPNIRASEFRRVKDCTTTTFDSASCALPARREWNSSTLAWASWVRRMTKAETTVNTTTSTTSSRPSRQFITMVSGSSTISETKVMMCSRKKPSHRPNRLSVPTSMIFISRPDWVSPWKDSGSDRTCWK